MNKAQLIEMIQGLPDSIEVEPFCYEESYGPQSKWVNQHELGDFGSIHHKKVYNKLDFRISFVTSFVGEFRRTYTCPDGTFFNTRQISPHSNVQ